MTIQTLRVTTEMYMIPDSEIRKLLNLTKTDIILSVRRAFEHPNMKADILVTVAKGD